MRRPKKERRCQTMMRAGLLRMLMMMLLLWHVAVLLHVVAVIANSVRVLLLARRFARRVVGAVKRCRRCRDYGRHGRSNRDDVVDEQLGRVHEIGFGRRQVRRLAGRTRLMMVVMVMVVVVVMSDSIQGFSG